VILELFLYHADRTQPIAKSLSIPDHDGTAIEHWFIPRTDGAGIGYAAIRFLPPVLFRNPPSWRHATNNMSTATTTEPTTCHNQSPRPTTQPTNTPLSQSERSAANRLRTTMAAVRLAFTWLGVRKTLAPE
jgi:hypothetical protein